MSKNPILILKHSSVSGKIPTTDQLEYGEITLNYNSDDPFISFKDTDNNIVKINANPKLVVDDELNEESTNPVENKAVTKAIFDNEEVVAAALNDLNDRKLDSSAYTVYDDSQLKNDISGLQTNKLDTSAYTVYNDSELKQSISVNTSAITALQDGVMFIKGDGVGSIQRSSDLADKATGNFAYSEAMCEMVYFEDDSFEYDSSANTFSVTGITNTSFAAGDSLWIDTDGNDNFVEVIIDSINYTTIDEDYYSATMKVHTADGSTVDFANIENIYYPNKSKAASGNYSHAEGSTTQAIGKYSHAEGNSTSASGESSHAEGKYTLAIGKSSHAEGTYTSAIGASSHAEGTYISASGYSSHAEGSFTSAIGDSSHAEGNSTKAIGDYTHAEGSSTQANGISSHAEGISTQAIGKYSHAEGNKTSASGESSHAEGYMTLASGDYSHAEGNKTSATKHSHAEGSNTQAIGESSHAEGTLTSASGITSHAEGDNTKAIGGSSHAEGSWTSAFGRESHAEGNSTSATTNYSHSEGESTLASGKSSHAEGAFTRAIGGYSHTEGYFTEAKNAYEHAEGTCNMSTSGVTIHSVGISTKINARKNAEEITTTGKKYILNVGGYDGTNVTSSNVKDVATVISNINSNPVLTATTADIIITFEDDTTETKTVYLKG